MTGHGAKSGRKQEEAIIALLSHRSIDDAAQAIRIAPRTLLRWMKEAEFDAAYREARSYGLSAISGATSAGVYCGGFHTLESYG
jgi:hypothetical protein